MAGTVVSQKKTFVIAKGLVRNQESRPLLLAALMQPRMTGKGTARSAAGPGFSCLMPKSSPHAGLSARDRDKPPLGCHQPNFCVPSGAPLGGTHTLGCHTACG